MSIQKLNIDLFEGVTESNYAKERAEYIAKFTTYERGYSTGLFGYRNGRDVPNPQLGEAKWNERFPKGFNDWRNEQRELTATGHQNIIDKLNEVIEYLNKKKK